MQKIITSRRLSIAAGFAASGAALAILMHESIESGHITLQQGLMPVLVGLTIIAGHLTTSAERERNLLSALGFALVFAVGTLLTVYVSVGQQAKTADTAAAVAIAATENKQRILKDINDVKAERASAKSMLATARKKMAKECASGRKTKCRGREATVAVYAAAVKGHDADLAKLNAKLDALAPAPVVGARPGRMAAVLAVFATNEQAARARYERVFALFEPFAFSLFLELGAIVAFGYGFGHRKAPKPVTKSKSSPGKRKHRSPGNGRGRKRDPNVIDFAERFQEMHGRKPNGAEIKCQFPDMPRSTAYSYAQAV